MDIVTAQRIDYMSLIELHPNNVEKINEIYKYLTNEQDYETAAKFRYAAHQIHPHQLEDIWQIGDFDEWFSYNGYRTYNQHDEECFHVAGKSAEYYSIAGVRQYFEKNIVGQSKTK